MCRKSYFFRLKQVNIQAEKNKYLFSDKTASFQKFDKSKVRSGILKNTIAECSILTCAIECLKSSDSLVQIPLFKTSKMQHMGIL